MILWALTRFLTATGDTFGAPRASQGVATRMFHEFWRMRGDEVMVRTTATFVLNLPSTPAALRALLRVALGQGTLRIEQMSTVGGRPSTSHASPHALRDLQSL